MPLLPSRQETTVFIERYFPLLSKDISAVNDALGQTLPAAVRTALEDELKKLQALSAVLNGDEKSAIHQLRAKLRWARTRLKTAKDASSRRKTETEIAGIEANIKREAERKHERR
jgi:hypothetical protein